MASYLLPPAEELPTSRHSAVGAWFFGPRAENSEFLKSAFGFIVDETHKARTTIYPNDTAFITEEMKNTGLYQGQITKLQTELSALNTALSQHSVPFWSPRYNAHMSMETSMPAMIGYLTGLIHNQNNVALEASPWTTFLEMQVGRDLCTMLGYNVTRNQQDYTVPVGWGHITCGGSIANLESIWSARNLKFYPLSLKLALEKGPLAFLKDILQIELCNGDTKNFMQCSTWELLNLKPSTILNIPDMLFQKFGVSQTVLGAALKPFTIQTTGKDFLEKRFGIEHPARIFIGTTKHYSWPKGGAITGVGSENVVDVSVDHQARLDPKALREKLEESLQSQRAVYSVVAIIGSTEHGAVDPLDEIVALRKEYEKKGLSFLIHADGAWGGYFTALIRKPEDYGETRDAAEVGEPPYVPTMGLSEYTEKQFVNLQHADSITIDPHKSGYCPYPAGGLCYRDGRQRFLVTWTSPYVYRGNVATDTESIGVFGVEGSKPGAAPVGAWLSHKILGLHQNGYGTLLGQAILTCSRLYCQWAAMDLKPLTIGNTKVKLIVTPFTLLPAEKKGGSKEEIEKEKEFIRENILGKDNETIYKNKRAVDLLKQVGGDIQINNFTCNYEIDGVVNTNVIEANYLNNFIFTKLSLSSIDINVADIPLFLTSTLFSEAAYGDCLRLYKKRLGLEGPEDLYTLINVTMNPWSTTFNFLEVLAKAFEDTANEALEAVVRRNVQRPDVHRFILQGIEGDRVCGVLMPLFNMQPNRWQLIISCKLEENVLKELREERKKDANTYLVFRNIVQRELDDLVKDGGSFEAQIQKGLDDANPISKKVQVTEIKILSKRSLQQKYLATTYPDHMTFYAYSAQGGSEAKPIFNVDHLLNVSPDIQLNSEAVTFKTKNTDEQKKAEDTVRGSGAWFTLIDVHESALQPLIQTSLDPKTDYNVPGLAWTPQAEHRFQARAAKPDNTPPSPSDPIIFEGTLTLGPAVYADAIRINEDGGTAKDLQQDDKVVSAPTPLLGHQPEDTVDSGLVAEHPTPVSFSSAYPEFKFLAQSRKVLSIAERFDRIRAEKAQEVIENCKEEDAPEWAKFLTRERGDGEDHANDGENGHY